MNHEFRFLDGKLQVRYSYFIPGHTTQSSYYEWGDWKFVPYVISEIDKLGENLND